MDLLELMRLSREKLKPHWGLAFLICLIYGIAVGVPSELNSYGELLSFLLAGPLQLGMCIFFLNSANNKPIAIENLMEGFKPLLQVLLAYAVMTIAILVGLVLFLFPGIVVSLGLSMTFFVMAENPEISFGDALQESWKLTEGYKMELLVLYLRFIPWYLLGLLLLVIGVFIAMALHQHTLAMYYEYLKEERARKEALTE